MTSPTKIGKISASGQSLRAWFTSEIHQMMHGFGDCRKPLMESAALIENIIHQQMNLVIQLSTEACMLRSGKTLSIEDFLFIMRKDKVKLRRLIKYLELKDLKAALKGAPLDKDESGAPSQSRKCTKLCYDFLRTIDQTGELLALFEDDGTDDVKQSRAFRAEFQTRHMDPEQYKHYCNARQVSFSRKYKSQKFRDWLYEESPPHVLKPNALALEVMCYLAYELLAQVVDLSLLVRQDSLSLGAADPGTPLLPASAMNHEDIPLILHLHDSAQSLADTTSDSQSDGVPTSNASTAKSIPEAKKVKKPRHSSPTGGALSLSGQALQPFEIREAIRRYNQSLDPTLWYTKRPTSRLLCC